MDLVFDKTRERVAQWAVNKEVLGVLLVGSRSRDNADALSDDDLEVVLTEEAAARISPADCSDVLIEGEGESRKLIYDAQYLSLEALLEKESSHIDLDHWPYERARILFSRDAELAAVVARLGAMPADFRTKRLIHSTIDAWVPPYRANKCLKRGQTASAHLLVARGARALSRLVFALEWRWVPLDHWLEPELRTLRDEAHVGPLIVEALNSGEPQPLQDALDALEPALQAAGVPGPAQRRDLFMELVHPSRSKERAIHGLQ
jgi:predicted nucleotidyltransferase